MADLTGKVAIITGTSSGIGLATARLFLSLGAKVLGVDLSPPTNPDLLQFSQDPHSAFAFLKADITQPTAAQEIVQACLSRFGERIDVLANVAGIMDTFRSADTVSDTQLDLVLNVNLKAPIKLMGAVIPVMKRQKSGSIVNVSSRAGYVGAASGVAYTASKHGLIGATKNVAWRFRDDGIRCNAIAPGGVITNISNNVQSDFDMESYMTLKPCHELDVSAERPPQNPEDVAPSIAFLASDMSKNISGVLLPVDRGLAAS